MYACMYLVVKKYVYTHDRAQSQGGQVRHPAAVPVCALAAGKIFMCM